MLYDFQESVDEAGHHGVVGDVLTPDIGALATASLDLERKKIF